MRQGAGDPPPRPVLASLRLRLVPLRTEDAVELAAVLADPALYAFTGGGPPSEEELRTLYGHQVAGRSPDGTEAWHNWIVRTRQPDEAVGFVQCTITGGVRAADVAWVIGVPWQGRGFATEAARAMVAWLEVRGVTTITAHVHPDHVASSRVAERAGLVATDEVEDGERVWRREVASGRPGAEPPAHPPGAEPPRLADPQADRLHEHHRLLDVDQDSERAR